MKHIFLFALVLFLEYVSSQSPCPSTLDFTNTGNSTTCEYVFTPDTTNTPKHICSISWTIYSYGNYGVACDPGEITANPLTYTFCFTGFYQVTMYVHFCDGSSCYVSKTVQVGCAGGVVCDPDPERDSIIPDPKVEITYLEPDTCDFNSISPVSGCMYSSNPNNRYYISCGWKWAIRVPPGNCNLFKYYVQYDSIRACGYYSCVRRNLDTNLICIKAYIDRPIYIVATAESCCLPEGYQRGYYWTPTPSAGVYNTISDPDPTVSTYCSAYRKCPNYTYCMTNPITMNQASGWPATCLWGGSQLEQRNVIVSETELNELKQIIIYTSDGKEIFRGKWKFGDPSSLHLNWPSHIRQGLYFVKYPGKGPIKLFKLN
jgi:hypothetical protein